MISIILARRKDFLFDLKHARKVGADFRNDLCNGMLKYFPDHIEDEGKVYPGNVY